VTLAATMGIDVVELPMLTGLVLPLRSTVGVAALLSRQPGRNFVEMNADLGIEGGPLGQLLRLGDNPLTLDSSIRIDRSGIKLQGVADTELMPQTFLDSGGTVEFFIPFGRLRDAYVRIGGELSVPIVGIATGGDAQLGGGQDESEAEVVDEGPSWWDDATTWIGSAASATATGVAGGAQAGLDAIQDAADAARGLDTGAVKEGASSAAGAVKEGAAAAAGAVAGGASTAAGAVKEGAAAAAGAVAGGASAAAGTVKEAAGAVAGSTVGSAAGSAISGATSGVACGVSRAQQLWCRTTGLCEVPEDACAEPAEEGQ
jgi:hypothetical protein